LGAVPLLGVSWVRMQYNVAWVYCGQTVARSK